MRLYYGGIPDNKDFHPEVEGWSPIREPGPIAVQFLAVPIALATLFVLIVLFGLVLSRQTLRTAGSLLINLPFFSSLVIVILLIPIHELIHAFCTPSFGLTSQTLIGVWPSKLLFFAYYEGAISRNHFLLIFLAPFIVLSILPIGIVALAGVISLSPAVISSLVLLSLLNGGAASGDLLGFGLALFQIPAKAQVRNKGWRTYWMIPNSL